MTTSLCSIIPLASTVTEKAAHIAIVDPHGWIITTVSISLVFLVLLLLSIAYTLSGYYFTHRHFLHRRSHQIRKENSISDEEAAAVAAALNAYLSETALHDTESGVITIKRRK